MNGTIEDKAADLVVTDEAFGAFEKQLAENPLSQNDGAQKLLAREPRWSVDEVKTHANATHLLECRHCIGQSCRTYHLRCHVLKDMGDGRLKVLAFGTMWKGSEQIQRVRYVESWKVSVKP